MINRYSSVFNLFRLSRFYWHILSMIKNGFVYFSTISIHVDVVYFKSILFALESNWYGKRQKTKKFVVRWLKAGCDVNLCSLPFWYKCFFGLIWLLFFIRLFYNMRCRYLKKNVFAVQIDVRTNVTKEHWTNERVKEKNNHITF